MSNKSKSCLKKQEEIKELFAPCKDLNAKYEQIISLGKEQPRLASEHKIPANLVTGCQSTMYLRATSKDGLIHFESESDALISAGLAVLLLKVYSGETAETILTCPPTYLEELGVRTILTPTRANGLYQIHLKMKQEALKLLMP